MSTKLQPTNPIFANRKAPWAVKFLFCSIGTIAVCSGVAEAQQPWELAEQSLQAPAVTQSEADAPATSFGMNLLDLMFKGGGLMVPLALLSLVVVAVGFERLIALRRRAVAPRGLLAGLNRLGEHTAGDSVTGRSLGGRSLDLLAVRSLCDRYPSAAARVADAMLRKAGRPEGEIDQAINEAAQREADRLHGGVRTLNMAASVAPLIGLLGTVWGMIQAFFATSNLGSQTNQTQALAEGIYIALVTTLAGLTIAIPAALLAHWFEGLILRRMNETAEVLTRLAPLIDPSHGAAGADSQAARRRTTIEPAHGPGPPHTASRIS